MKRTTILIIILSVVVLSVAVFTISSVAQSEDGKPTFIAFGRDSFTEDYQNKTILKHTFKRDEIDVPTKYVQNPITMTTVINSQAELEEVLADPSSVAVDFDRETVIIFTYIAGSSGQTLYIDNIRTDDKTVYVDILNQVFEEVRFDSGISRQRYLIITTEKLDVDSAIVSIDGKTDHDESWSWERAELDR